MNTILLVQFMGALLGMLAIVIGAFGAHRLKKSFTLEQRLQFDTGLKFHLLHAVLLVVLGFNLGFNSPIEDYIAYCFIFGTLFFSFSIYGLTWAASRNKKAKWLGPITPIGGLLLLVGWGLLLYYGIAFIL
ncbi:MAG: DUF423 domain-containing protein [Eudoraea sp.]|nr:DUF423 domain-containing protein [Eudoraea sp.]